MIFLRGFKKRIKPSVGDSDIGYQSWKLALWWVYREKQSELSNTFCFTFKTKKCIISIQFFPSCELKQYEFRTFLPSVYGNGSFMAEHWARLFRNHSASRDCDIQRLWDVESRCIVSDLNYTGSLPKCRTCNETFTHQQSLLLIVRVFPEMPSAWQGFSLYHFSSLW